MWDREEELSPCSSSQKLEVSRMGQVEEREDSRCVTAFGLHDSFHSIGRMHDSLSDRAADGAADHIFPKM